MADAVLPDAAHAEVLVATTWRCNLGCAYCFVRPQQQAGPDSDMTPELSRCVIDGLDRGLRSARTIGVHLYGGEPLLNRPALRALVSNAGRKPRNRFRFAITTNGTILSTEVFYLLGQARFDVVLSVDGPAAVHDRCRRTRTGAATHARVLRFLHRLRSETSCPVRGSAVVRAGWRLRSATAYLRRLEVDTIKAQAVRGAPGTPYALRPREQEEYRQDLEEVGDQVIADLEAGQFPRDDRFASRVLQLLAGRRRTSFCGAGRTNFGITPTGEVLPCVLLDPGEHRLGHITDDPRTWRRAGETWRRNRPRRAMCAKCEAEPLCGGGCPAIMPVCGADECEITRQNCRIARRIHDHFRARPERLLRLAGIQL
jgi:uncharacterized protein